tara:strand:+ start:4757 stop:6826 length:2070 start_codon:yes stop_codon:yes gene_type:complete
LTNYFWTGAADTNSLNASNWTPSAVPGAGDVVIFDNQATQDCFWQHTATGASITVDEMILEDSFQYALRLQTVPTIKGMFLNKNIRDGSANSIKFASGPISSGGYKTYGSKYVLIGDNVVYTNGRQNLTFEFNATAVCAFDDGQHPKINLTGGNFTPKYTTPTGTSDKTDFYQLEIDAGCTLTPDVSIATNDKNKKFKFASQTTTQFVCNIATVNWGSSTVEFTGVTSSTFNLPVSTTTNYNSGDFFAQYRKVILTADTAGYRIDMQDNTFLSVEEFEIGDGLLFVGPRALNAQGSDIRTILPPKIRGSWSFSSISDGIYRSPRQASGPMPKVQGNFHITGKLDVDGLIDPTGLELNPQGSNPGGVAANTLWLNSGDSNKLYHGSSEVGGGGGGGDITAVNTNAPITGGATSGAVTLSLSASSASAAGSMSSAHYSKLEGIEASADVTGATNVTAAGALMDSEVTNLAFVKSLASGVSNGNVLVANAAVSDNDFLKIDGTSVEGRTATEMRSDLNVADGATAYTDGDAIGACTPLINNNTTLINTNITSINDVKTKAKVYAYMTGNQSYSSGSLKINHNAVLYDVGGNYDTTNNCFTAPRDGYYLVTCSYYSSATPTWGMSLIYIDTGSGSYSTYILRRPSSNGQDNMISSVVKLDANDKIAHFANQSGSTTIQSGLNSLTYFTVTEML